MADHPPLEIRLFGTFDARVNGAALPKLRSRKEKWLLALLVLEHGRDVSRSWLAQTLWPFPDHSADQAAYNLRRSLTNLRKALGTQAHRLQPPTPHNLRLDLEGAEADVAAFDAAISRNDPASLQAAVALYRGPLLVECTEAWVTPERAKREMAYLKALKELSSRALAGGDHEAAVHFLRLALAVNPLWEPAVRALMEALAKSGDPNAALQIYQQFSRLLHRDRNTLPDAETTALFNTLRAELRRPDRAKPTSPETESTPSPTARRIPIPLTTLIGRAEEVREIKARLQMTRLLTLTGASGVGKTRLAIQVAEELAEDYYGGAWFVDLAALTDPAHVLQTVASVLEVREEPGHSLTQTLADALHSRHLLLILDNCEHLVVACAPLAESLLQRCRHLRILATSRQPLGVGGEGVWRVPSLSLPDPRQLPASDEALPPLLSAYAAIQLFVERANLIHPAFRMTPQNARAVAQVCLQLDGIPHAIELAAALVKALPVEQIAQRLHNRFRLLTGGPRTALSRQQTLEAAIKWSYDLLSPAERALLCRLSVFAGGWTLEAAETVCEGVGCRVWGVGETTTQNRGNGEMRKWGNEENPTPYTLHPTPFDLLSQLVDKSLVLYEEQGGQARYRLLETVRQYGRERLMEAGEAEAISRLHRDYFLRLAEEAEPKLDERDAALWLNRLETEHDNLRAALEWSLAEAERVKGRRGEGETQSPPHPLTLSPFHPFTPSGEADLRLAGALWRFWNRRGYLSAGRAYLVRALAQSAEARPTAARAKACNGAGMLTFFQGDTTAARPFFEEALAIGQALGDKRLIAHALRNLGQMTWYWSDHAAARGFYAEALALQREAASPEEVAATLNNLGIVASDQGDTMAARQYFEEALAIGKAQGNDTLITSSLHSLAHQAFFQEDFAAARELYAEVLKIVTALGDKTLIAIARHRLGSVDYASGDFASARALLEASLALGRELEEKSLMAAALYNLGNTLCAQGDLAAAQSCFEERLTINLHLGDKRNVAYSLDAFAYLAIAQGETKRAATLFGAAEALREALHVPLSFSPSDRAEYDRNVTATREALGEPVFTTAWNAGRALTLEQGVAFAKVVSSQ